MKKITYSLGLILSAAFFFACDSMEDIHREFIVPGGITYPQKADGLTLFEGKNRVRLQWAKGTDPKVVKARVYWNNYTDSVNVDISATESIVSVDINNLSEDTHTFFVRTYDADGNESVVSEVTGQTYGDMYQASINPRKLSIMEANDAADMVKLNWGAANATAVRFGLTYRDTSGNLRELAIPLDEEQTILTDYQPDGDFATSTWYRPTPTALDTFVVTEDGTFPEQLFVVSSSQLSIDSCDSQVAGELAVNAIDDNVNNCWQTPWSPPAPFPHYLIINLGTSLDIGKIELYRRGGTYADTKTVQLFLGADPNPAAVTWNQIGTVTFPADGNDNLRTLDIARGTNTSGQYLKLLLEDSYRNSFVQVAEIYIYVRQ